MLKTTITTIIAILIAILIAMLKSIFDKLTQFSLWVFSLLAPTDEIFDNPIVEYVEGDREGVGITYDEESGRPRHKVFIKPS